MTESKELRELNTYCASRLTILGTLQHDDTSELDEIKSFRTEANSAWLELRLPKSKRQTKTIAHKMRLKKLTVTSKELTSVAVQFFTYPLLKTGQFASSKPVELWELIDQSAKWDSSSPILAQHALTMNEDLTELDVALRQIVCA